MAGAKLKSGVIEFAGANTPGWMSNLGIVLSAGTLSIVDAQGATITDENPGWVSCRSTTAGRLANLKVTVGGAVNDDSHASSHLTNVGFGITETVAWANDAPFFLYVVNRANSNIDGADGSSAFFFTRSPCLKATPSAANSIGDTGAGPVTDDQDAIFIMDDVTVANYTSLPCQLIGSFKMQWSTITDDWTVSALANADGLGQASLAAKFAQAWTFPAGQNGAAADAYMRANGGTAPIFSTQSYSYKIGADGRVHCEVYLNADGGTDGAGAVTAQLALPYTIDTGIASQVLETAIGTTAGATTISLGAAINGTFTDGVSYVEFNYQATGVDADAITNAMYSAGARRVNCSFSYNAFNSN